MKAKEKVGNEDQERLVGIKPSLGSRKKNRQRTSGRQLKALMPCCLRELIDNLIQWYKPLYICVVSMNTSLNNIKEIKPTSNQDQGIKSRKLRIDFPTYSPKI